MAVFKSYLALLFRFASILNLRNKRIGCENYLEKSVLLWYYINLKKV